MPFLPETPRMSVNKLGEFLTTSSAVRRRAIIRDQKKPPPQVVPLYRQADEAIAAFLNGGGMDATPILDAAKALRAAVPKSEWEERDNRNTAEALECFLEAADHLPMDGVTYVPGDPSARPLKIAGVSISVRPNFLLRFEKRGEKYIGALKLHFIKSDDKALKEGGQEYVAMLCHEWLSAHGPSGRTPARTHCFSVDLFRHSVVRAPAAVTRRRQNVEAACQEIALAWPGL